jgi:hypothetical protein
LLASDLHLERYGTRPRKVTRVGNNGEYTSNYYPQKDLDLIQRAARMFKERGGK